MRCLVTGAAGFVGSYPGERSLADGHEACGIDAFIDYYSWQIKEKNLSIVRSSEYFNFISNMVGMNIQAGSKQKVVSEAVNIVEGSCVSLCKVMQILQAVSDMPVNIADQEKRLGCVDYTYTDTSWAYAIPGYNLRVSLCEGWAREFADIAELYGYSKDAQVMVA